MFQLHVLIVFICKINLSDNNIYNCYYFTVWELFDYDPAL